VPFFSFSKPLLKVAFTKVLLALGAGDAGRSGGAARRRNAEMSITH